MAWARLFARVGGTVAVLLSLAHPDARAQDARQNAPGQFDFYVLALSWSPSFCATAGERAKEQQCGARPYSFVVHGLWPQYEKGFPEYCQVPAPRLDRNIVASMLDVMPARRLVYRQWDRHGTCSGLTPRAYFDQIRKARAVVKIPEEFLDVTAPLNVAPDAVEDAFARANEGLPRDAIAVTCGDRHLQEVRICLSKDFRFRSCGEVDGRACRRDQVLMPPARGG